MRIFLLLALFLFSCTPYRQEGVALALCCTDLGIELQKQQNQKLFCLGSFGCECYWEMFEDEALNELVEAALACNPDILIAERRIEIAKSYARKAKSKLMPHVYFLGDFFRKKVSRFGSEVVGDLGSFTEASFLFSVNYEVDLWKKNRAYYAAAIGEVCSAIAERKQAELLLSIAVCESYFRLQYHQRQKALIQKQIECQIELNMLTSQREKYGVAREDPIYQTDSALRLMTQKLFVFKELCEIDRLTLQALSTANCCELIGELPLDALSPDRFVLPKDLAFDLLARRPDVIANRFLVESQRFRIHAARARFFPSLNLLSYIGTESFKLSKLFSYPTLISLADAIGLLPIFTAGKLSAELSIEEQQFELVLQQYNQSVIQAVFEVTSEMSTLVARDDKCLEIQKKVVDQASLMQLSLKRLENGVENKLGYLLSKSDLLETEELYTSVLLERMESYLLLIQAIGGGYEFKK